MFFARSAIARKANIGVIRIDVENEQELSLSGGPGSGLRRSADELAKVRDAPRRVISRTTIVLRSRRFTHGRRYVTPKFAARLFRFDPHRETNDLPEGRRAAESLLLRRPTLAVSGIESSEAGGALQLNFSRVF